MERRRSSRLREVKEAEETKEIEEVKEMAERAGVVRTYSDLLVYQQAYRLALDVSRLTKEFPRQEQFEMGRQIRNCSRSVAANIVEGWAKRNSAAEFKRHLMISIGECAETKFWIDLATDEVLIEAKRAGPLGSEYGKLGFMRHNLWKEWRKF
jgi:four helix bundle protein